MAPVMCVRVYLCLRVCIYVYRYICISMYVCVCIYACMYVRMCALYAHTRIYLPPTGNVYARDGASQAADGDDPSPWGAGWAVAVTSSFADPVG